MQTVSEGSHSPLPSTTEATGKDKHHGHEPKSKSPSKPLPKHHSLDSPTVKSPGPPPTVPDGKATAPAEGKAQSPATKASTKFPKTHTPPTATPKDEAVPQPKAVET